MLETYLIQSFNYMVCILNKRGFKPKLYIKLVDFTMFDIGLFSDMTRSTPHQLPVVCEIIHLD